jgi:anti-sigma factor RsiW
MMATSKKILAQEPSEIEMLLPWHAAGTLNARDARRVDEALARDPGLARQYAAIQEEYAETIHLNESLGAPSARAMQKLFAAIDGEPARKPSVSLNISARIAEFFAGLSPRTLAYSAALGALALLLQAGVIGAILAKQQGGTFETASLSAPKETIVRSLGQQTAPRAFVRFAPDARVSDITAFLDANQAVIIDSTSGGMFRLQFGDKPMSRQEIAGLMTRLQNEKIINLAAPAQ